MNKTKALTSLGITLLFAPLAVFGRLETGAVAPEFTLTDTSGAERSLSEFKGNYVVLEWTNHECPFVKKHYASGNMQNLQREFTEKGVVWLTVLSSGKGKQGCVSAEKANALIEASESAPTAYLLDYDGAVGRRYAAQTTPHMYVIDPEGKLVYQGAIDDVRSADPSDVKGAKNYISVALGELMAGSSVSVSDTQPYGCSVKYTRK